MHLKIIPSIFIFLFSLQFILLFNFINYITNKNKIIVSVIIPFTSKGLYKKCINLKIYDLLLIQLFYPSFIQTITPENYVYKLYLGISYDDCIFKRNELLKDLKYFLKNKIFLVYSLFLV